MRRFKVDPSAEDYQGHLSRADLLGDLKGVVKVSPNAQSYGVPLGGGNVSHGAPLFFSILFFILQMPLFAEAAPIRVVATTEDLAAIAREIGKERVAVDFIAKGVQDPHFIEAKPSYMVKLSQADLFVQVGLELEAAWVPSLLVGARNGKIQAGAPGFVDASKGIEALEVPTGEVDRAQGDVHLQGNPHYWLDPANGKQIARNIAEGLKRIDPAGAADYEKNLAGFTERLDSALLRWREEMKPFAGAKVVTYHNSWPYFLKRFGLIAAGHVEPKPGIPPSTAHLKALINLIPREKVKVIIMEPYFDEKTPQFVAEKSGAKVVVLPPSVSAATGINDIFQLFDHLISTLAGALSGAALK